MKQPTFRPRKPKSVSFKDGLFKLLQNVNRRFKDGLFKLLQNANRRFKDGLPFGPTHGVPPPKSGK